MVADFPSRSLQANSSSEPRSAPPRHPLVAVHTKRPAVQPLWRTAIIRSRHATKLLINGETATADDRGTRRRQPANRIAAKRDGGRGGGRGTRQGPKGEGRGGGRTAGGGAGQRGNGARGDPPAQAMPDPACPCAYRYDRWRGIQIRTPAATGTIDAPGPAAPVQAASSTPASTIPRRSFRFRSPCARSLARWLPLPLSRQQPSPARSRSVVRQGQLVQGGNERRPRHQQ